MTPAKTFLTRFDLPPGAAVIRVRVAFDGRNFETVERGPGWERLGDTLFVVSTECSRFIVEWSWPPNPAPL